MDWIQKISLAHLVVTLMMTGVIWVVQLVIYPQFSDIGNDAFAGYHREYMKRITWIVGPLMLAEIATALVLAGASWGSTSFWWWAAGLGLVGLIWASTAFISVPQHGALELGLTDSRVRALVMGNWLRTILWSARSGLVIYLVIKCLR
ncbi:MAG: hypothetical protein AAF226_17410 [Verrucomicrobiota bacterium]